MPKYRTQEEQRSYVDRMMRLSNAVRRDRENTLTLLSPGEEKNRLTESDLEILMEMVRPGAKPSRAQKNPL